MQAGGPQLFMLTTICIDPDHGCRVFRVPDLMGMDSEGVMVVHPVMAGPGQNWTWLNQEAKLARQNLMERIMDPAYGDGHGRTMLQLLAQTSVFSMPPMQFSFINIRMSSGQNHGIRVPQGTRKSKEVTMNRFMFASNCNHVT